jgi:hypothetical protein
VRRILIPGFILTFVIVVCVVIYSFASRRHLLTAWLEKSPSVHLCGIKIRNGTRAIYITNSIDLFQIDSGVREADRAPSPFGGSKEAYLCLNGKWCGQIVLSWSVNKASIGIPQTAFDTEFKYYQFSVPIAVAKHLSEAVGAD